MFSYAAVIGHQPHVSVAELAASAADFDLQETIGKNIILFTSSADLDDDLLARLGGTILLAKRISDDALTSEDIPTIMVNEVEKVRGKIVFGLRAVGLSSATVHTLYRRTKKLIKEMGRNCRYVGTDRKPAPPVLLRDAGLIDGKHGCELTLIMANDGNDLWVGRTVGAQDVNAYTKRDMDKPVRDTTIGLLPPKLAQTLLNLSAWMAEQPVKVEKTRGRKPKNKTLFTVLDPFCGTGVIPMECLLHEWGVLASDVSQKAVNGCTKNLDWLRKEEGILKKDLPSTVWKQDAQKPFTLKELPNVVVTETTLGPALTKRPAVREAQKLRNDNEKIQAAFLKNAAATLPGVPIVCTWPAWFHAKESVKLEKIWKVIESLGYEAVLPTGIEPADPERLTILYRRPGQFVGREIVMLRLKKTGESEASN
jgi:hypothetical protein